MSMITADCFARRWQDKTVTLSRAEDDHGRVGEIRRGSGRPARLRGRPGSPSSSTLLDRTLSLARSTTAGAIETRAHTHTGGRPARLSTARSLLARLPRPKQSEAQPGSTPPSLRGFRRPPPRWPPRRVPPPPTGARQTPLPPLTTPTWTPEERTTRRRRCRGSARRRPARTTLPLPGRPPARPSRALQAPRRSRRSRAMPAGPASASRLSLARLVTSGEEGADLRGALLATGSSAIGTSRCRRASTSRGPTSRSARLVPPSAARAT
jgi:hypothetical protein